LPGDQWLAPSREPTDSFAHTIGAGILWGKRVDARLAGDTLAFENWRFDRQARLLYRQDPLGERTLASIGSRALEVLAVLLDKPGDLVSKDTIMAVVWPNTAVEANNLNVQIAALRRVIDAGRQGPSCIQTTSGRGYRFVLPVSWDSDVLEPAQAPPEDSNLAVSGDRSAAWRRHGKWLALLGGFGLLAVVLVLGPLRHSLLFWQSDPPRLSLVVLPFENLGDDSQDDYLADGITDDLTSDLSQIPGTFVIARQSAYTYKAKHEGTRRIAQDLGVRYVIQGSVRRIGPMLRINVQLTSGETGAQLWSDRFDEAVTGLAAGQEQIVTRLRSELGVSLFQIAQARSWREQPTNPDAFDLILRGRALYNEPTNVQRHIEAQALFERALALDPSSVEAITWVVLCLIESADREGWRNLEEMQRVERLVARASEIAPDTRETLGATFQWLRATGRCSEAIPVAAKLVQLFPNYALGYAYLGSCKLVTGRAEEDLALEETAIRLNPRDPNMFLRYWRMGTAAVLLGRDQEAVPFLEQAIVLEGDYGGSKAAIHRVLSVALARSGRTDDAKRSLAEANRLWPYDTVRSYFPDDPADAVLADQIRRYQDGLRLAGQRDHADENADFGTPDAGLLHRAMIGRTPMTPPDVRTIRTADLPSLLAEARPLVIDTATNSWGRSIPGAVGLKYAGIAGDFQDAAQDHLRRKLRMLTSGDPDRPIIAMGWNSERFDGRNLALRLVALGYTRVYWYRGGREAWEVAGLPEAALDVQEW
jgi:TolB-like protein/DNA-binding winged helix-turn-helix (wHTH) protein